MTKDKATAKIKLGALICSIYVIFSAFGAHGLKNNLSPAQLDTFQTGLRYVIIHGLAIILISLVYRIQNTYNAWVYRLIYGGLLFFSSSLMLHATKGLIGIQSNVFAMIAPVGGSFYVLSWLVFAWSVQKK